MQAKFNPEKFNPDNPAVGIYTGVSFLDYFNAKAVGRSDLVPMRQSAKLFNHAMLHPDPEPGRPLVVGDAAHAWVLEPDRFGNEYAVCPDFANDPLVMLEVAISKAIKAKVLSKDVTFSTKDRREAVKNISEDGTVMVYEEELKLTSVNRNTNIYKEAVSAWGRAHVGDILITEPEWADIQAWKRAVESDKLARHLLIEAKGFTELVVIFERHDVLCKCRIDRYVQWKGHQVIADFKTALTVFPPLWSKAAAKYEYDTQAGMYLLAMQYHEDVPRRFFDVAVRKDADNDVVVYELGPEDLLAAQTTVDSWLMRVAECRESGYWPGIGGGKVQRYEMPKWRS